MNTEEAVESYLNLNGNISDTKKWLRTCHRTELIEFCEVLANELKGSYSCEDTLKRVRALL